MKKIVVSLLCLSSFTLSPFWFTIDYSVAKRGPSVDVTFRCPEARRPLFASVVRTLGFSDIKTLIRNLLQETTMAAPGDFKQVMITFDGEEEPLIVTDLAVLDLLSGEALARIEGIEVICSNMLIGPALAQVEGISARVDVAV